MQLPRRLKLLSRAASLPTSEPQRHRILAPNRDVDRAKTGLKDILLPGRGDLPFGEAEPGLSKVGGQLGGECLLLEFVPGRPISFDHLFRLRLYIKRNGDAERFGRLQIEVARLVQSFKASPPRGNRCVPPARLVR